VEGEVMSETAQRRVLITGGASGIGLAVAQAFTTRGDFVCSFDRHTSSGAAVNVVGDVRSEADNLAACAASVGPEGLDVLVLNAGVHDGGVDLAVDPQELSLTMRTLFDVNVVGCALAMNACASALRKADGCVIFTLSDASFLAGQTGAGPAYTSAKHAQLGLMNWAARWFAPRVRVNGVAPGGVITGLNAVRGDDLVGAPLFADEGAKRSLIASRNLLGTVMEPHDIASLFLFLASDAAAGMTGQVLRPDGGLSLR